MPLLKEQLYTIEDIYNLPEGERAELIDGQIYNMAPPKRKHQRISGALYSAIYNYIKSKKGSCEVFSAPFAVFLNANNRTYVEPDISVICDKSKLENGKGCNGAPDWIIEIVSPSTKSMDYGIKLFKYCNAGVREYWIVDKQKNRVTVYNFQNDDVSEYTFNDLVKAGIYTDLEIDFSEL